MRAWLEQVQGRTKGKGIGYNKYRELYQGAVAQRDMGFFLNRRCYEFKIGDIVACIQSDVMIR